MLKLNIFCSLLLIIEVGDNLKYLIIKEIIGVKSDFPLNTIDSTSLIYSLYEFCSPFFEVNMSTYIKIS